MNLLGYVLEADLGNDKPYHYFVAYSSNGVVHNCQVDLEKPIASWDDICLLATRVEDMSFDRDVVVINYILMNVDDLGPTKC
jgi:hypothetical protein